MAEINGRPRRKAFYGYAMHEAMTGISEAGMNGIRVEHKRYRLATKAMAHARSFVNEPANVMRVNEAQRHEEYHGHVKTRSYVKSDLIPYAKEQKPGAQYISQSFGAIAGAAEMRREGACMEMSSLVMDYLGEKTRKYQAKLSDPEISEQDRKKYEFKMGAIGSTNLMQGNNGPVNHMWVRLGAPEDPNSVAADAWGRGGATASKNFRGKDVFTENTKVFPFTPKMMTDLSDVTQAVRSKPGAVGEVQGLQHDGGDYFGYSAKSQAQHQNEI